MLRGLNKKALLKISGGPGVMSGLIIRDIGFKALPGADNLEIAGTCNGKLQNLRFYTGETGILFHNESPGYFTEFIVGDDCVFDSACHQAVRYKRTNGNDSFNGSGIEHAKINQYEKETLAKIQIDEGCFPYNAPLSGQFWVRCEAPIIKNRNTNRHVSFKGDITLECTPGTYTGVISDETATKNVYYAGHVLSLGEKFQFGKRFFLVERVQLNPDGSVSHWRKPYSLSFDLKKGDNILDVALDSDVSTLLNVTVYGANYEYSYLVSIYKNRTDNNGSISILHEQRSLNDAKYGSPILSFLNGTLVITNPYFPETGIKCSISAVGIGGRSQYRLT